MRSAVIYALFGGANALLLFLTNILLVKMVEPSSYGQINVALSYFVVIIPLISFNALGIVGIKRAVLDDHEFGIFNNAYTQIIWFGTIVSFIASITISIYLNSITYLTFIGPVYICFVAITDYSSAILIQDGKPITYGFAILISRSLGIIVIYALIYSGCNGLLSYFIGVTIGEGASIIFRINNGNLSLFKNIHCSMVNVRNFSKEIILYGVTLLPLLFFGWSFNGLDKIVISKNEGMSSVALYSFAMMLAQSFSVINSAIMNVKMPKIYKGLASKVPENVRYGRFLISFLIGGGLILPFSYLAIIFLIPMINSQYEGSAGIAIILIISVIFNGAYRLVISITDFYKKNIHKTFLTIFASLFAFTLMISFVEKGGIISVALSVLAGNAFLFIGALFLANYFTKVRK